MTYSVECRAYAEHGASVSLEKCTAERTMMIERIKTLEARIETFTRSLEAAEARIAELEGRKGKR